jgi:hypothetical protein
MMPGAVIAGRMADASSAEFLGRRSKGFVELLAFEASHPELFDARLPSSGVPYWSIVRFTLARLIGDALFGTHTMQSSRSRPSLSSQTKSAIHGWRRVRAARSSSLARLSATPDAVPDISTG